MTSSYRRLRLVFSPVALALSLTVAGLPLIAAPLESLDTLKLTPALRPADDNSVPHVFKFNGYREPLASAGAQSKDPDVERKDGSKSSGAADSGEGLVWHDWDEALFEQARKEKKFIVLDLEAVWCHWCHVMDHETYSRADIRKALNQNFICVKVDQDSRPDLSHRYEDYGWPATIIFDAEGKELVKRSGYINPDKMLALLQAVVRDPSPQPLSESDETPIAFASEGVLPDSLKEELSKKHIDGFDSKYGAWGRFHKFLDWDSVDYSIELAIAGDKEAGGRARKTLDGQLNLLDPVWGGVYQYSTDGDWSHPHFEKIMQMQAENMRIYAIGYSVFGDEKYLKASRSIASYLEKFLTSPDGAFYTSQDADVVQGEHSGEYFELDDAGRRKAGIPRVDKHIYARENGWAIEALAYLYMVTGEQRYLDSATRAAEWVKKNRAISSGSPGPSGGGFRHDESTGSGPYLGDSLAMGRAFLSLYEATADRQWLALAESAASFIAGHFADDAGYLTADSRSSKVVRPQPLLEENVRLARFANLLGQYTGDEKYGKMAKNAMRFLATPAVARRKKVLVAGILLADREIANAPTHITIVGSKKDQEARALFLAALMGPAVYRRLEWYDREEGKLPNMAVDYPELPQAAAFSCGDGKCSTPAFEPDSVRALFRVREI